MQNKARFLLRNKTKLLTIVQAAQFLGVSPDTLRRWEARGIITPQRTKGGSRRYTLLDLKIAKLNKRKIRFFQIPTLLQQNYISSRRDLKVAILTSFLWILSLLAYHFLLPALLKPANPEQQILSEQLKNQTHLNIVSQTTNGISILLSKKTGGVEVLITPDQLPSTDQANPTATSIESDLLIQSSDNLPPLEYTSTPNEYYSLQPLPQNQIPTLIKRN